MSVSKFNYFPHIWVSPAGLRHAAIACVVGIATPTRDHHRRNPAVWSAKIATPRKDSCELRDATLIAAEMPLQSRTSLQRNRFGLEVFVNSSWRFWSQRPWKPVFIRSFVPRTSGPSLDPISFCSNYRHAESTTLVSGGAVSTGFLPAVHSFVYIACTTGSKYRQRH